MAEGRDKFRRLLEISVSRGLSVISTCTKDAVCVDRQRKIRAKDYGGIEKQVMPYTEQFA